MTTPLATDDRTTDASGSRSLDTFAETKLDALERRDRRRRPVATERADGVHVVRAGRRMRSFSCNDYLGLSFHPEVRAAAARAIARYGTTSGGSYLVTGNHPLYERFEAELAAFKGTPAVCIFGSGYLANAGLLPALAGPGDAVFVDALAHSCLWFGARASGAAVVPFAHNDVEALAAALAASRARYRHTILATDGVFSMDGDLAPLGALSALANRYDAWLLCDDAHGLGTLAEGRGAVALAGAVDVPLQMGTLSKALGSYGGYVAASDAVVALLKNRARTFVYSTALPPATIAAASAALAIVRRDAELTRRPLARARRFAARLGLPEAASAIVPIHVGGDAAALAASQRLAEAGFLVVAIRPPTVPEGTARLRVAFTALHTDDDVDALAAAVTALRLAP